jgi:hypothetical protein
MARVQASTCRLAVPTLFLAPPIWLCAWDAPWTCLRHGAARVLASTEECCNCPWWEPAADHAHPHGNQGAVSAATPDARRR